MSSVMKTLFLNPPSFESFDGGAGSRWPATREISLSGIRYGSAIRQECCRAAGCWTPHRTKSRRSRRFEISKDYEFVVLFTSTVGFRAT